MKKVAVLTGTRAEYGLLKPVMAEIDKHPDLELSLIVTGMHLSQKHGHSIDLIKKDGFNIDAEVHMTPEDDTGYSIAHSIGNGISRIADALKDISPDFLVVLGDRTEALAGSIAAAYMNIIVGHIHGGDSARAGLDESARHAITKFAHIHFVASKKSAERVFKMGEDSWRIYTVGAPGLDSIYGMNYMNKEEIEERFHINLEKPLLLLIQHSVSTEPEQAGRHMKETLEAIKELSYQTIVIYPNNDAGHDAIIGQIKKYEDCPHIRTFKNLSQREYLSLLKYASVMVGNSSSGIIEAPSFGLPVVNIGIRQEGRERAENIIDVPPDKDKIYMAIKKALDDESFIRKCSEAANPYGDGKAGERIAEILSKIDDKEKLIKKKLRY